ncbi:MAG: hypothetical protein DRP62_06540 [Planctomycetota bacterium]|nr:MAG: hypothetical protein DRP62_06540 [Planctomycetota bacterium]
MKDSKKYSGKVRRLRSSLKKKYPRVSRVSVAHDELVDALVYAIVSENMSETEAQSVMRKLSNYFVDWNDLRVSREEEIIEVLGADTPTTRNICSTLRKVLRAVFDKYHTVSLEALKKLGKRQARQALEKIDGVSSFVVDYCMLTSLAGHAIPLTKKMTEFLRSEQLVHPSANEREIKGFLTKQISAANAYEFYALLRHQSEKKVKSKKKTKSS